MRECLLTRGNCNSDSSRKYILTWNLLFLIVRACHSIRGLDESGLNRPAMQISHSPPKEGLLGSFQILATAAGAGGGRGPFRS